MRNNESTRNAMEEEVMWHGIRNIIANEGEERTMRHVTIELWREYFKRFGMVEMKMSDSSLYQAKTVVEKFTGKNSFTLEMNENFVTIGWKGTPLNSLSAWKFHKRSTFHIANYLTLWIRFRQMFCSNTQKMLFDSKSIIHSVIFWNHNMDLIVQSKHNLEFKWCLMLIFLFYLMLIL